MENGTRGPRQWQRPEVEERLKRISQAIIEAYRSKDSAFIRDYARQAGLSGEHASLPLNKLFGRVIQVFHPDRLGAVMERIAGSDGGAEAFLALRERSGRVAGRTGDRGTRSSYGDDRYAAAFGAEADEEEFSYGDEDFGYSEVDAEDLDGEYAFDEREETMDILEAVKRAYLGNLDGYPSPLELETLEGDLDLSGMGIDDAEGAQWLKSLSSLNLAGNAISNCEPIGKAERLEFLDLSGNHLEDADALAGLDFLSELDLSGNDIEDFSFLERLPSLGYVNLSGNPPLPRALRDRLRVKGVIVIQ